MIAKVEKITKKSLANGRSFWIVTANGKELTAGKIAESFEVGKEYDFILTENSRGEKTKISGIAGKENNSKPAFGKTPEERDSIVRQTAGKIAIEMTGLLASATPNCQPESIYEFFDAAFPFVLSKLRGESPNTKEGVNSNSTQETLDGFVEEAQEAFSLTPKQSELLQSLAKVQSPAVKDRLLIALTSGQKDGRTYAGNADIKTYSDKRCDWIIGKLKSMDTCNGNPERCGKSCVTTYPHDSLEGCSLLPLKYICPFVEEE